MYALKLLHHFHFTVFVCLLVIIFHLFSVTRMYTKPVALPTEIISFLSICLSTYLLYLPTYLVMSSLASDGRVHVTQTDRQTDRHCPQLESGTSCLSRMHHSLTVITLRRPARFCLLSVPATPTVYHLWSIRPRHLRCLHQSEGV